MADVKSNMWDVAVDIHKLGEQWQDIPTWDARKNDRRHRIEKMRVFLGK